jgi:hypothetical protein
MPAARHTVVLIFLPLHPISVHRRDSLHFVGLDTNVSSLLFLTCVNFLHLTRSYSLSRGLIAYRPSLTSAHHCRRRPGV